MMAATSAATAEAARREFEIKLLILVLIIVVQVLGKCMVIGLLGTWTFRATVDRVLEMCTSIGKCTAGVGSHHPTKVSLQNLGFPKWRVPKATMMENQMEKKMENEMETEDM